MKKHPVKHIHHISKPHEEEKPHITHKTRLLVFLRSSLWFILGSLIGLFFFLSFIFLYYKHQYEKVVYPGVYINAQNVSGKSPEEIEKIFEKKNEQLQEILFTFTTETGVATASGKSLNVGINAKLLSDQAFSIGRSNDFFNDISIIYQAYTQGINLSPSYYTTDSSLMKEITPLRTNIKTDPIDARFSFENGRVKEFRPSQEGKDVDIDKLQLLLRQEIQRLTLNSSSKNLPKNITLPLPIKILKPKITTEEVNNMGIKELIATGTSLYQGSIENRIYNVALAASRIDGALIPPGTTFSFVKTVGDVSKLTGYKQAYVIENGKTVLGDGGGVCQVSTTLFRAALNAGLPIVERNPHAYRVHYYEEDSPVGIDAAVYIPTVDLKFKNDTAHYLLIQAINDPSTLRLTFEIYGTKDDRQVTLTQPIITSQTKAPEPLYQDDPNLPKGEVKQIDFAADGATVSFSRTVTKNGKVVSQDRFPSNYRAWQAVYLRGTKE